MTDLLPVLAGALAVFVGSTLQRSTGMGFALVTSPFMILALGPVEGIVVTNVGSAATALVSAYQLRHDFDLPRARWLIPAGLVGCVPGAAVVRVLPADWIGVVVGTLVLVALVVTLTAPSGRFADGRRMRVATGLISGFLNTSAGVGGPALAVYTRSIGWPRAPFAATATVIFCIQGVAAILLKERWPSVGMGGWAVLAAAAVVGLVAGGVLHGRLDDRSAMRTVMTLALAGTVLALAKALFAVTR
ncbi:MAG: sulfite exporter TauE/SafE family protein [Austwickia sp.]|nr:sulfite exporter TauE/SafE family protein [Actinomycetota bacterium]MCO5311146.1 sulfite exporter TauE/SafE family protein [Austwickia sp.]